MRRLANIVALAGLLTALPAGALAASGSLAGTWNKLPAAPFAVPQSPTSVWTGSQLIVFGRAPATNPATNVAESFDPAAGSWTRLAPPSGPGYQPTYKALWSGKEMLSFGPTSAVAYAPKRKAWRKLRRTLPLGIVVWTGREAIGWGGGCCGDAQSNGAAYNPRNGAFRTLPRSPLAPSQGPLGAWTGREVLLFVSGLTPDGKPYPSRFARAAAYDPARTSWRRIAPMPANGGSAAWDGRELLVAGAGGQGNETYAYNPTVNTWCRLASLPATRRGAAAVWNGTHLFLWGGSTQRGTPARGGLAYDPRANRWSVLPPSPLRLRDGATVVWAGKQLIVWGGVIGTPLGTSTPPKYLADGAGFTPSR